MKNICLLVTLTVFYINVDAQIKMNSTGKVVIGTGDPSSSYRLKVNSGNTWINGDFDMGQSSYPRPYIKMTYLTLKATLLDLPDINVGGLGTSSDQWGSIYGESIYADGEYLGSDLRLKENIRDIDNSLEKIKLLRPVKFDFKSIPVPDVPEWKEYVIEKNIKRKNRTGFIAQEVLNVIPDIVEYDIVGDKFYIDYNAIIPYLVEAMQEQQMVIEKIKSDLSLLRGDSTENLKSDIITSIRNSTPNNSSYLYQNDPNPFNIDTKIRFYIPEDINNSVLYLYDLQGKQIKSYKIVDRGFSNIIIHGYELDPGIYLFTLIVEGKEIDTKRMILTD